ncbi:tyrosine-type recombinase/integrase [Clostridium sp.]|uniref:tyrosine-type recombinase/integrase n=1 Tax=Clostridium sp. TaxID=1506 RepID=UPI002606F14A|nr:tyrosine-type recombinase/integrase [Clostridium sp.]
MHFHDLRHTFTNRLFENSVKPKTIQTLLCHSDISTNLNIYSYYKNKTINRLIFLFKLR